MGTAIIEGKRKRVNRHISTNPVSLTPITHFLPPPHPTYAGIQYRAPNTTFPPAAACMKHFIAYPAAVNGHDRSPIELASRTVKQLYAPPFRAAVQEAGVKSAMEVRVCLCGLMWCLCVSMSDFNRC